MLGQSIFRKYARTYHIQRDAINPLYIDMPFRTTPFTRYVRTCHIQSNEMNSLCIDTSYTERICHLTIMFGHFTYREKLSFIHLICLDISYTWQKCHLSNMLAHLIYKAKMSCILYAWPSHIQSKMSFILYAWTPHIQSKNVFYPLCLDTSYTEQKCHLSFMLGHLTHIEKISIMIHYACTSHIQSKNVIYPLCLAISYTEQNVIYPLCLDTSYTKQKCHLSFMLGHLIYRAKMSFINYAWTPHTHRKNINYDPLRLSFIHYV